MIEPVSAPRCTYEPPRGPCGVCWYCKTWAKTATPSELIDAIYQRMRQAEIMGGASDFIYVGHGFIAQLAFEHGWRAWGGPK